MLTTTLNRLKEQPFDENNWEELLTFLGKTGPDDEPLPLAAVMEAIDVYDAAGALATVPGHDAAVRLFACACLRRILDHSEKKHPRYKQPGKTLMAVEAFIRGEIFPEELRRAEEKLDAAYLRFRGEGHGYWAAWSVVRVLRRDAGWLERIVICAARHGEDAVPWLRREFTRLINLEGEYGHVDHDC